MTLVLLKMSRNSTMNPKLTNGPFHKAYYFLLRQDLSKEGFIANAVQQLHICKLRFTFWWTEGIKKTQNGVSLYEP